MSTPTASSSTRQTSDRRRHDESGTTTNNNLNPRRIQTGLPGIRRTVYDGALRVNSDAYDVLSSTVRDVHSNTICRVTLSTLNSLCKGYVKGKIVEKDQKKELYHMEEAAIGGHPRARCNLGYMETRSGRIDRAMKHYIIAAKTGCGLLSIRNVRLLCDRGGVTKEDFAAALRAHQATDRIGCRCNKTSAEGGSRRSSIQKRHHLEEDDDFI